MRILVTGAAGFIGSKLMSSLARRGDEVVGVDNMNDYYDVRLKRGRLEEFGGGCRFIETDIADKKSLDSVFASGHFDKVVNLAAQAGVRHSIADPYPYLRSNLEGFLNILEACRNYEVKHLLYASSSSVYGLNPKFPSCEDDRTDRPVSFYAASKGGGELMAHAYCRLFGIPMTGLRLFTVYGPWGRPDMAPMLFARAISRGEPVRLFNGGDMVRDFTYIDDAVAGIATCVDSEPAPDAYGMPYRIYNIGCGNAVRLLDFVSELERAMGIEAKKEFLPMQPGDVVRTGADTGKILAETGFKPQIRLREGLARFVEWYKSDKNPLE